MSKNKLHIWDLSEIFKNYKDTKIDNEQNKLNKNVNAFVKKWKGKIKELDGKELSYCIKEYEKIKRSNLGFEDPFTKTL